ncbi:MAG: tetratricopeptide repeat protein, partial [Gammaproteobacteria bacterium]
MMQSDSAVTSAEPVQQTLAQAIRHQQHAEYAQAENLYRRVLETQPQQPDALHYMGLLAHQTGRA